MNQHTLANRVEILEKTVEGLAELPNRMGALEGRMGALEGRMDGRSRIASFATADRDEDGVFCRPHRDA